MLGNLKDMNFDVVIIGAGIAGLSCADAIVEADNNLSLAIIEGNSVGSNNPSPLTFYEVVQKYNLLDCVKEKYSSFTFHNINGSSVKYLFSKDLLAVLDYKKACAKIFERFNKDNDDFIFINQYAADIQQNDETVQIELKNGEQISTKILIDASGKEQFTTQRFNKPNVSYYSHVYGAFFSNVQRLNEPMCCYLMPNQELGSGGGWFYSIGKGNASFGYAKITDSPNANLAELKEIFNRALVNFEPYATYLKDAKIEYVETGMIPITHLEKFMQGRILIIGDAAGMATNWTCMGVEPSLTYGKLAGEISVKVIKQNDAGLLNEFQLVWDKENREVSDLNAKQTRNFWNSSHYFWEWIIKNDLANLSSKQIIKRLRRNAYLLRKDQIFTRTLQYKVKSFFNKKVTELQDFVIAK